MALLPELKHPVITLAILTPILLSACGGGSGGSAPEAKSEQNSQAPATATSAGTSGSAGATSGATSGATVAPPPEPVADGSRIDLVRAGYMPLVGGATWTYQVRDEVGNTLGTLDRSLALLPTGSTVDYLIYTTSTGSKPSNYVKTEDGIYFDFSRSTSFPPQAAAQIGLIREFLVSTYNAGENIRVAREGVWDEDIDGDGVHERFILEYSQVYHGMQAMALPWDRTAEVAIIGSQYDIRITTSRVPQQTMGKISRHTDYFAKNVGLVRTVTSAVDQQQRIVEPTTDFVIQSALVKGVSYSAR